MIGTRIAAGLVCALRGYFPADAEAVERLFLSFIVLAGIFGAATVTPAPGKGLMVRAIFLGVQSLPAALALALAWNR